MEITGDISKELLLEIIKDLEESASDMIKDGHAVFEWEYKEHPKTICTLFIGKRIIERDNNDLH